MNRINMDHIIGIILAGGQGSRLTPLTKERSKPAVPLGGRYRIVDFPITNCIHSGVGKIFVLTQYLSASLNHHIARTYKFDMFHDSFVDIIASEATKDLSNSGFSQGTADAVRKGMKHIRNIKNITHSLILAGDQLYKMNFRKLRNIHQKYDAHLTLGVVAVPRSEADSFGIVKINEDQQVLDFWEKPGDAQLDQDWYIPEKLRVKYQLPKDTVFASMSMYLMDLQLLDEILSEKHEMMDFGKEIIPYMINNDQFHVQVAIHNDYWEDIGTLYNFHRANLHLSCESSGFNIYDPNWNVLSRPSLLPPSLFQDSSVHCSLIGDGCHIYQSTVKNCTIGQRCIIQKNSHIENSVIMGADWLETKDDILKNQKEGIPNIGIGSNCVIKNTIIDKNARIGNNVVLTNEKNLNDVETENYVIRDNILVIPAKAVIPDNFKI